MSSIFDKNFILTTLMRTVGISKIHLSTFLKYRDAGQIFLFVIAIIAILLRIIRGKNLF